MSEAAQSVVVVVALGTIQALDGDTNRGQRSLASLRMGSLVESALALGEGIDRGSEPSPGSLGAEPDR